jgi:heptosyltransferase-2
VDRVYVWEPESWLKLQSLQFDVVMNFDKAIASAALIMSLNATTKLGYGLNNRSVIIPLNREAEYNYRLGLDDNLKFRLNQKPNTQLLAEAVGLKYERDEYVLKLSIEETRFCDAYRQRIEFSGHSTFSHASISNSSEPVRGPDNIGGDEIASRRRRDRRSPMIVGFNTGCSLLFPNKKMTIDQHVILIDELSKRDGLRILLLGGPEDAERNAEIVRRVGDKVVGTPTMEGIRRGICYENLCDVIITGDSFGMHVAIALKKYVIVWFGVSCPQEIDLYDRGVKLIPEGLSCSPCWKRECPYQLECIQMIDLDRIIKEVDLYRDNISALGAGEQRP